MRTSKRNALASFVWIGGKQLSSTLAVTELVKSAAQAQIPATRVGPKYPTKSGFTDACAVRFLSKFAFALNV